MKQRFLCVLSGLAATALAVATSARAAEGLPAMGKLEIRREQGGIVIARPVTPRTTLALRIGPRPAGQNPGPRVMVSIAAPFQCRVPGKE